MTPRTFWLIAAGVFSLIALGVPRGRAMNGRWLNLPERKRPAAAKFSPLAASPGCAVLAQHVRGSFLKLLV
jgi:hypothetical protein